MIARRPQDGRLPDAAPDAPAPAAPRATIAGGAPGTPQLPPEAPLDSARLRVLTIFAALAVLLLLGLTAWQFQETRRTQALLKGFTDESLDAVQRVVELEGRSLQQFVTDYSPWDDMVRFANGEGTADPQWARNNLVSAQGNFHTDTLWIYSRDRRRVYSWTSEQARAHAEDAAAEASVGGSMKPLEILTAPPPEVFERLDGARQIHYYADTPGGVLEVRAATIHPSADFDRRGDPQGYFFAGRLWDDEAVKRLEPLTGFKVRLLRGPVQLAQEAQQMEEDEDGTTIRLKYRLLGLDGRSAGAFAFSRPSPALSEMLRTSRRAILVVAAADAALLALLFWALHAHLTAPLSAVAGYLAGPAPQWLVRLSRAGSEFRRIGVMLEAAARAQQERAALSAILSDVSRPLRRREVLEAFARGMQERLQVPGGVVLLPAAGARRDGEGGGDGEDATASAEDVAALPRLRCGVAWGLDAATGERIAAGYAGLLPASASAGSLAAASGVGYVRDDPALASSGLPEARPGWAVRRVVPLAAGGAVRGLALLFGPEEPGEMPGTSRAGDLYAALGSGLGVALENARLFEEVQGSQRALQTLSHRLVEVQEQERAHLARELHDEVGQLLTGLRLTMALAEQAKDDTERQSRREEIRSILGDLTQRVRSMSLDLRPPQLDDFGLAAAVGWLTKRFSDRTGIAVDLDRDPGVEERRFTAPIETAAYRIIQEALTNVARHSGAAEARVALWAEEGDPETGSGASLCLRVEDEGDGFAWDGRSVVRPSEASAPVPTGGGLGGGGGGSGLLGMRERAELLGGRFTVETAPGRGTRITVSLPLPAA